MTPKAVLRAHEILKLPFAPSPGWRAKLKKLPARPVELERAHAELFKAA